MGYCLAAVGTEGLPSLLTALANPQLPCCEPAAFCLSIGPPFDFGTNAAIAIPLLAKLVSNTNENLAVSAIKAIGRLHMEPQVAVPALTNALYSTSLTLRREAAESLGRFGNQASCAVPALRAALTDSSRGVRAVATNAILEIAPEAL